RGDAGQAPRARGYYRSFDPADDTGRDLRRPRPARTAPRRILPDGRARPGQAALHHAADLVGRDEEQPRPRPEGRPLPRRRGVRRLPPGDRRVFVRARGCADPGWVAHPRRGAAGEQRVDLIAAMMRLDNGEVPSYRRAVARWFELDPDWIFDNPGSPL